jgi:cytidine deaminase
MKYEKLTIQFTRYEHRNDLPKKYQTLFEEAIAASANAYAPYSEFHVGAAILLQNGTVVKGSNQENAAYPSGLCAERAAVYWTGANYPEEPIEAIAITAVKDGGVHRHPVTPCGACRQALLEYELRQDEPIKVIRPSSD